MNNTWTRYSSVAGRQRESGHKLTSILGMGAAGRGGRTPGGRHQRSDTGKDMTLTSKQGWMLQASLGALHSWWEEVLFNTDFPLLLLKLNSALFCTRDTPSAQQGAGSEPRLHMGGGLTSWCCFPLELPLWMFSSVGISRTPCHERDPFSVFTMELASRNGLCVFSKASFQNWTCVYFLNCTPNLRRLSLFVLMDESESQTRLFSSSSLGREHRKIIFAYVYVWGGFFSLFFCLSHSPWASRHPDHDKPPCVGWGRSGSSAQYHSWCSQISEQCPVFQIQSLGELGELLSWRQPYLVCLSSIHAN